MKRKSTRAALATGVLLFACAAVEAQTPDYQRADQMLTWNALRHVYNDYVAPTWYRDSTRFWYATNTPRGQEFITVNPALGTRALLFDNARLASALSLAADSAFAPGKLPFAQFKFGDEGRDEKHIRTRVGKRDFVCDIVAYTCIKSDTLPNRSRFVRSPDEKWDAFASGNNLWIRPVAGGDSVQLTTDGASKFAYGVGSPSPTIIRMHVSVPPEVFWSPDSKRLVVARIDERDVQMFHVYSSTTTRPTHYEYPYALPGDSIVPTIAWYVIDVASKGVKPVDVPPAPNMSFYTFSAAPLRWAASSDRFYFTNSDRGPKHVRLLVADASRGTTRTLIADSSTSYVIGGLDVFSGAANWRPLKNGDAIWFSERDGFGHLYHVGADGNIRHQITAGDWVVTQLLSVDETLGRVYFIARGREAGKHPEYDFLYSAALDGSGITLLTPENATHHITAVPSGKYFVDTYSKLDTPPVSVVRAADGRVVKELERADDAELRATGWRPGEVFYAKARDGVTNISGAIYKPSNFDSTKHYPVIDHIYPGPLISPVSKEYFPSRAPFTYSKTGQVQALAELGFIVVEIDALGNEPRSRALYQSWYGNMGDNGIPDHVAAIKQLGARFRWMDLTRVGIFGHSGGGFSSTDAMLRYPDFYSVAVSTSGNHDNRTYYHGWGERFQGLLVKDTLRGTDNFAPAANKTIASNLKGKLLLIHGDLDDNVHPAHTIALVDALIKANRPFDMLILPDANHDLTSHPYVIRRTWDYFVEHLLGQQPPTSFAVTMPTP
jgi:dipeptidyl aminopeptidase/acylaminoacyl peptidase